MATTTRTERQSLSFRPPAALHKQLRIHAALTGRPINETMVKVLEEWMAGPGRDEMVDAAGEQAQRENRVALDALKDM